MSSICRIILLNYLLVYRPDITYCQGKRVDIGGGEIGQKSDVHFVVSRYDRYSRSCVDESQQRCRIILLLYTTCGEKFILH